MPKKYTLKWKRTPRGNLVLNQQGYYISYNDFKSCPTIDYLTRWIDKNFSNYVTTEETALMVAEEEARVLTGDWRKEFVEAIKKGGLKECKSLFDNLSSNYRSPSN